MLDPALQRSKLALLVAAGMLLDQVVEERLGLDSPSEL
jgi:hypothetical protein